MTPIQAAVKAGREFMGDYPSPIGEDDARAIILAFLDAAELDQRTADMARRAIENNQHTSHFGQARAAITALKEAANG